MCSRFSSEGFELRSARSFARSVGRSVGVIVSVCARAHSHALIQIETDKEDRERKTDTECWGVVQRQARVHSHRTWWFVRRRTCDRAKNRGRFLRRKKTQRCPFYLLVINVTLLPSMRSSTGFRHQRFSVNFSCSTRRYTNSYMGTVRTTTSSDKREDQRRSWVNRARKKGVVRTLAERACIVSSARRTIEVRENRRVYSESSSVYRCIRACTRTTERGGGR